MVPWAHPSLSVADALTLELEDELKTDGWTMGRSGNTFSTQLMQIGRQGGVLTILTWDRSAKTVTVMVLSENTDRLYNRFASDQTVSLTEMQTGYHAIAINSANDRTVTVESGAPIGNLLKTSRTGNGNLTVTTDNNETFDGPPSKVLDQKGYVLWRKQTATAWVVLETSVPSI